MKFPLIYSVLSHTFCFVHSSIFATVLIISVYSPLGLNEMYYINQLIVINPVTLYLCIIPLHL